MNANDRATIDVSLSGTRLLGRATLVLWLFELLVFSLFVNKVRQTSDWALQFSRQTQAEVGQWTLSMFVIFLFALICTLTWLSARKRLRVQAVATTMSIPNQPRRFRGSSRCFGNARTGPLRADPMAPQ